MKEGPGHSLFHYSYQCSLDQNILFIIFLKQQLTLTNKFVCCQNSFEWSLRDFCVPIISLHTSFVLWIINVRLQLKQLNKEIINGFECVLSIFSALFYSLVYSAEFLWMAPELLRTFPPRRYSQPGDVYSFAIILYELATRIEPYTNESWYQSVDGMIHFMYFY